MWENWKNKTTFTLKTLKVVRVKVHNVVEQRPGWKKYIIGETNAANSLVKVIYKNIKIKIFDLALSKKIAEKVFWVILPKISKGDKVSPRLSAMLT